MKRAIITGLLILILFGAGDTPRLVAVLEGPTGSTELASVPISCKDTRAQLDLMFGERDHCIERCAQDVNADGTYAVHIGITPQLRCVGPRGSVVIPGTGSLETVPVTFCADEHCARLVDYCDCHPPNLSITTSPAWYSEPFVAQIEAFDNHELDRIETTMVHRCSGTNCTANVTVPIGTACSVTGSGTCAVLVNATDRWENTAEHVALYNVDLSPPIVQHEWLGSGVWHEELVRIRFEARESTSDESGVSAIWVETRTSPGCSEPGSNYTRHPGERVELAVEDPGSGVSFCYYATDRAIPANRADVQRTETRYADTTPPKITLLPSPGWYNENVQIRITCTDEQSGCAAYGYAMANGTCPPITSPAYRTSPMITNCPQGTSCTYDLCGWGRDRVGRLVTERYEVSVDTSPPVIEIARTQRVGDRLMIDVLLSDAGSGLDTCEVVVDDEIGPPCEVEGTVTSTTIPIECPESCMYTIRVSDRAGNEAAFEDIHTSI